MAEKQAVNGKQAEPKPDPKVDPMEAFRGLRDGYLDAWAKAMTETVNTEAYASGWFYKIKLSNPAELNTLLTPEQYQAQIAGA